tara:strand:+ start:566 stop:1531 length:966 start_codon:yes stop_codon:yes gene_type:complete
MANNLWFRELGYFNNPFSIKPAAFHDKVIGNEELIDEISYGILNNKILLLDADFGEGKSTVLRRVLNDFGGKSKVIYYSCNRMGKRINLKKLLNGRYGLIGKWFDMKPKDMILLLDEAQELCKKDYEKIQSYYEGGYFKAVVLVGVGFDKKEIPSNVNDHLKEISIKKLNVDQVMDLLKKRVGVLPMLTKEVVSELYDLSDNNVRKLLKNCEEVCKYTVTFGEDKITSEVIKEALEIKEPSKATKERVIEKVKEKVAKKKEVKKEEQKPAKKSVKKPQKGEKLEAKKPKVYNPDENLYLKGSAEELLNKGTDEIFSDDQYF